MSWFKRPSSDGSEPVIVLEWRLNVLNLTRRSSSDGRELVSLLTARDKYVSWLKRPSSDGREPVVTVMKCGGETREKCRCRL
jgi:hypothetical protein